MAWNNLLNFIAGGTRKGELADTRALYRRVEALAAASPIAGNLDLFAAELVREALVTADLVPIEPLRAALTRAVRSIAAQDPSIADVPGVSNFMALTIEESVALRERLRRRERFLLDPPHLLAQWRATVIKALDRLLRAMPATAFKDDPDEQDPDAGIPGVSVPLVALLEDPAWAVDDLVSTFFAEGPVKADLFSIQRRHFERRFCVASGIPWEERHTSRRPIVGPSDMPGTPATRLADLFLEGTPWHAFALTPLPLSIPVAARFEHTHIVGGSGHGKTQLLQIQIVRDILESANDGRSVVVMDSQGDLLRTLGSLAVFAPGHPSGLSERLMVIDPTDVEYPVALNMFDFKHEEIAKLPLVERERILNGTIELFEYFFGALLGAELTARQGIVFKYLARLMLEIPDATVHTFRQLMEEGEAFRPYMEKLPTTARAFFETRFFDRSFNETKKQVLTRLWGVLSNATFDRMFSHPRSKVDMFSALQEGRIVFINTAKDLLKDEGAAILGRFFIALIAQAAMRRATIPAHERRPCFFYVDEAADYVDERIGSLLNQARKYKVGMTLAHQNLDQLSATLRASFASSTSIKLVGGVSTKDAAAFASEMHTDADFIRAQRKRKAETSFACYVRNVTPQALGITVPLGTVEQLPTMTAADQEALRVANRKRYCVPLAEVPEPQGIPALQRRVPARAKVSTEAQGATPVPMAAPAPPAEIAVEEPAIEKREVATPQPIASKAPVAAKLKSRRAEPVAVPPPLGRGGKEHRYLQNLLREFAQSKGFLATVEETILDGAGRVDVSLSKDSLEVACEISVTTGRDYELGNIEKCLAADYSRVLFVSSDARHLKAMQKLATGRFEEDELAKLHFASPEEALAILGEIAGPTETQSTVRGYRVKTRQVVVAPEEAARRRETVASVIARSLRENRPE
ncbi:MAG: hypothetical protein EPO55_20305 [Reyranella sp.]|uniref:type IV secretory system conjugative DNA transfer family protein n=1 Tax=Reyranella sp. TaxID=1929291 RepID=UPI00121F2F75|nr:type IV secretory system conjugative DNA transfer family protein [Reyranella sp.]TAJ36870.1 MAG: hypothetical protein EPO55_20305 [Reyranella sp.]